MSVVLDGVLGSVVSNTTAALSGESVAVLLYALSKLERPSDWLDLRENPLDEITVSDWDTIERLIGEAAYQLMTLYSPIPVGFLGFWPDNNIPSGWLVCNGQAVSRTTYAVLFDQWGTAFGAGDGSTTFNLIDMRDRSPMGVGLTSSPGDAEGELEHTLTVNEMPAHNHAYIRTGGPAGANINMTVGSLTSDVVMTKTTDNRGGGEAHNNLHPIRRGHFIVFTGVES